MHGREPTRQPKVGLRHTPCGFPRALNGLPRRVGYVIPRSDNRSALTPELDEAEHRERRVARRRRGPLRLA